MCRGVQLLLVSCALATGASVARADAAPATVEALMEKFAAAGAVRATFVSEQSIAVLTAPLESAGRLYFEPPSTMVRETERPGSAKVVVEAGRATFRDETGTRHFDLASNEIAAGLVENLMIVLRGDLAALRDRFETRYAVEGEQWSLRIRPRQRRVREWIREIVFGGSSEVLVSMSTFETNGDHTRVTFADVELGAVLSTSERGEWFAIDAAPGAIGGAARGGDPP